MTDFSQYASTFNCGLIAFEKFDLDRLPPAWFLWRQYLLWGCCHGNNIIDNRPYKKNAFDW